MNNLYRRKYIRTCVGVVPLLSGCINLTRYDGHADLVLDSASDTDYHVIFQVSEPNSGEQVFEETYDVEAGDQVVEEEIVEEGVYNIRVTIEDRTNSETDFELACEEDRDEDDDEVTLAILLDEGYRTSISKLCR